MSKKLRVLQLGKFYPPHRGGMEAHLESLCVGLKDSVSLQVLVSGTTRHTVVENVGGVEVTRLGRLAEAAATSICPEMIARLRHDDSDIVHLHHPNPFATLAILASRHKGRIVVTYHSDVIRQKILNQPFQMLLRRLLNRSSAIIATSPNYVDSSPVLPAYRDICRIIPLGMPVAAFDNADPAAVEAIRRRYGSRIVLSVGRLVYYKGYQYLVDAMRRIDGVALIIGSGPLADTLKERARRAGVENRVQLLGDVEDLRPYYKAASVFALPSIARSEAFGIVQTEAMACGTPVVNTRLETGVPFVSRDNVTGFTVAPKDAAALAEAIQYLLDHEELRLSFGANARRRVDARFTQEYMAAQTLDLYHQVLGAPPRRLAASAFTS